MPPFLRTAHKYLSLTFGLLWLLQAATGTLLVFRGELEDATLAGPNQPLDQAAFAAAVSRLEADRKPSTLTFILPSEGSKNRYDLLFEAPDGLTRVLRVDGEGQLVADRPRDHDYPAPGLFQTALDFHESLFSGQRGMWFMGISGLLLLTNIVGGICIAWPRPGQAWRRVLLPGTAGTAPVKLYKWHRALGLAFAAIALVTVTTGILQEYPVDHWMGVQRPDPPPREGHAPFAVPFGAALATAFARYPGAPIALIEMPAADHPWYRIGVRQHDDTRRVFGWTSVLVDAQDGRVLLDVPAADLPLRNKIYNSFYSIHTGEFFRLGGRVVVLFVGLWMLTMATFGFGLWWTRRKMRQAARQRTRTAEAV